jgi:two-component system sensor histidine kinase DesK
LTEDFEGLRAERQASWILVGLLAYTFYRRILELPGTIDGPLDWMAVLDLTVVVPAVFVLQIVHSHPRFKEYRRRYGPWSLAAQLAIAVSAALLLSSTQFFSTGLIGYGAASAWLILRRPWSWLVYALAAVSIPAICLYYDQPALDTFWWVNNLLITSTGVVGISMLVESIAGLHRARAELVRIAVASEGRKIRDQLGQELKVRLVALSERADDAARLLAVSPAAARERLSEIIVGARAAVADARGIAGDYRLPPWPAPQDRTRPRTANLLVIAHSSLVCGYDVVYAIVHRPTPIVTVIAIAAGAVSLALMIRHLLPPANGVRPRGWGATLAAQAVLAIAPIPLTGIAWIGMPMMLAATMLVLLPVRIALPAMILITGADCVYYLTTDSSLLMASYYLTATSGFALTAYFLADFARVALRLRTAHAELAWMARTQERVRLSKDVHDLVSSGLSALLLKAELAQTQLAANDPEASHELDDIAGLARRSARLIDEFHLPGSGLSLEEEVASARSILGSAGISGVVDAVPAQLPGVLDKVLAVVVREAIANVLRHSDARHCSVGIERTRDHVRLTVTNDGLTRAPGAGTGIGNLRSRVEAVGGSLDTELSAEAFQLTVVLPCAPELAELL